MNLGELLDLLRLKGVKTYKGPVNGYSGGVDAPHVEVELGLSEDNIEDAKAGTTIEPENCRCGHPEFAHVNGLCTHGCSIEQCAPPEDAKEVK